MFISKTKIAILISGLVLTGLGCAPALTETPIEDAAIDNQSPVDEPNPNSNDSTTENPATETTEEAEPSAEDDATTVASSEEADPIAAENPSSETPATTNETPEATDPTDTAPATIATRSPVPFGFWGLNGFISTDGLADVAMRFNATIFQVASSAPHYTATSLLPLVRASGMQVTLRMTGDHGDYTTSGNFDLQ